MVLLQTLARDSEAEAIFELFDCWADGDDIVLFKPNACQCIQCIQNPQIAAVLPMLRQQHPDKDGFCWCLSDFIRTKEQVCHSAALHPQIKSYDKIGVFATTFKASPSAELPTDPYSQMLLQTLSDRLAEAAAERLHEQVRKLYWGYAKDENLTPDQLFKCQYSGIRPAIGYPCMPDVSLNFTLNELLHFKDIGISLTEHAMMQPHASISGLMIAHPKARYFSIGEIGEDQWLDYSRRRGIDIKSYLNVTN